MKIVALICAYFLSLSFHFYACFIFVMFIIMIYLFKYFVFRIFYLCLFVDLHDRGFPHATSLTPFPHPQGGCPAGPGGCRGAVRRVPPPPSRTAAAGAGTPPHAAPPRGCPPHGVPADGPGGRQWRRCVPRSWPGSPGGVSPFPTCDFLFRAILKLSEAFISSSFRLFTSPTLAPHHRPGPHSVIFFN